MRGFPRAIVDGVLIERMELLEARVHGTRQGIKRGVMFARSLREVLRVCGKVVPEPIEIDAFATLPRGAPCRDRRTGNAKAADSLKIFPKDQCLGLARRSQPAL